MGTAQGDLQQGAVDHGGLIDQHQTQVFKGLGGLLGFLAALQIPFPLQPQPQQAMDRGWIPGGP